MIKKSNLYILLASVFLSSFSAYASNTGQELATKVYNRPDGKNVSIKGSMILIEKNHDPRVRKYYMYRMDKGDNMVFSLIRFTHPSDINGTGLLTYDYPGDKNEQLLYLPELDRSRKIASNRKGGRFVGSDLFYEDLRDREVAMDNHRLLGQKKFNGVLCDILESIPVDAKNSTYSKRVSWIHPQSLIALQVEFYQYRKDKPTKRLQVYKIEKIQGYWTVMDSTMSELESGHMTRLKIEKVVYDRKLPISLFKRQVLEDPVKEAKYRP